jgi:hypothetical protein
MFVVEYLASNHLKQKKNVFCLPLQSYHTSLAIDQLLPKDNWNKKTVAFNFCINKIRPNRIWLIQYLDQLNLSTTAYSINNSPVNGLVDQYWLGPESEIKFGQINNNNLKNLEIYQNYLKQNVYEPSFVSLITEPGCNDVSTFITEKTLFAFEAGTIPIWVGGYQQAQQLKNLGFDVFDDIVDHSYQSLEDPMQRNKQAIDANLDLLTNVEKLKKFFDNNIARFQRNRDHMRSNNWFYRHLNREIGTSKINSSQLITLFRRLIIEHNQQWPLIKLT